MDYLGPRSHPNSFIRNGQANHNCDVIGGGRRRAVPPEHALQVWPRSTVDQWLAEWDDEKKTDVPRYSCLPFDGSQKPSAGMSTACVNESLLIWFCFVFCFVFLATRSVGAGRAAAVARTAEAQDHHQEQEEAPAPPDAPQGRREARLQRRRCVGGGVVVVASRRRRRRRRCRRRRCRRRRRRRRRRRFDCGLRPGQRRRTQAPSRKGGEQGQRHRGRRCQQRYSKQNSQSFSHRRESAIDWKIQ